jgi:hypothetical protein
MAGVVKTGADAKAPLSVECNSAGVMIAILPGNC